MWKNSGNEFFGHLGGWVFNIYPIMHSIMGGGGGGQPPPPPLPPIPISIFVEFVKIFSSSLIQHLRWNSLWQKLLLTVVTESLVLNMTSHNIDPKRRDKFWLRQWYSIWHLHLPSQQEITLEQCVKYIQIYQYRHQNNVWCFYS